MIMQLGQLQLRFSNRNKTVFKGREICIASNHKKSTSEAFKLGSHSFYTANTPWLYLVSVYPTAPPLTDSSYLIAVYYSFIDPKRMKGWVGLVSWPTADGLPISCRSGIIKFADQRPTFYHWATSLTLVVHLSHLVHNSAAAAAAILSSMLFVNTELISITDPVSGLDCTVDLWPDLVQIMCDLLWPFQQLPCSQSKPAQTLITTGKFRRNKLNTDKLINCETVTTQNSNFQHCTHKWMNEWMNERTNERTNERMIEWRSTSHSTHTTSSWDESFLADKKCANNT